MAETDRSEQGPPPGWYPHPDMADTQRYWDGEKWTEVAPMLPRPPSSGAASGLLTALLLAGTVLGLILSQQSVSVLTGSGIVWTGTAICAATVIVAWFVKATSTWVRWVCTFAFAIALASAVYVEQQLSETRDDITDIGSIAGYLASPGPT